MVCEHLFPIEQAILASGARETFRGQPWALNCREWVYFDAFLDLAAIRKRFCLPDSVQDHVHRGTHDGQERGLVCSLCNDAVVGIVDPTSGKPIFDGRATVV